MKRYYTHFLLLVLGLSLADPVIQAQFSIDAQLRSRFEFRDGYQRLAVSSSVPAMLISQRTRISFRYEDEKIILVFAPQDVRIWGGDQVGASSAVPNNTLGLFEGYAEIKLGEIGWVSVGRQPLVYDSRRLLGDRNWNQNGISYDALVFKLHPNKWKIHLGLTWNTLKESLADNFYPSSKIKTQEYLWINRKLNDQWEISLLHLATGISASDSTNKIRFRQTTGLYATSRGTHYGFWGNAYYQYGVNARGMKVSALLVDADFNYSLSKLKAGMGISYLSGNHVTGEAQDKDRLFDVFNGNLHLYFGFMDYFKSFGSHTTQGGLMDSYLYLEYKPVKDISIKNIVHHFRLAQTNEISPKNPDLGWENDLVCGYRFNTWGNIEAGYLFYLPTASLKEIQKRSEHKFSQFFYLQLTLVPSLLK